MAKLADDEMIIGVTEPETAMGSGPAAVKAAVPAAGEGESLVLRLADLLPDNAGEVVLFAGEDMPINLLTDEPLSLSGITEAHVTASGVDVTGHNFYSFGSGITVYSPTDLFISSPDPVHRI